MVKVTLGDKEFTVPKMNIGQVEDLADLDVPPKKWSFAALGILMRRADPEVKDIRDIEASPGDVREAIQKILAASGYQMPDPKNQPAPEIPGQEETDQE